MVQNQVFPPRYCTTIESHESRYFKSLKDEIYRPNVAIDIYLSFDDRTDADIGVYTGPRLTHPYGMSGGGIWDSDVTSEKEIWTPYSAKLIGIQCALGKKVLRGVQILHWLLLVQQYYPELQPLIEEKIMHDKTAISN